MGKQTETQDRVSSFQIGEDEEADTVAVETLLMKLAMAETVIRDRGRYIEDVENNGGEIPDGTEAPDPWAITGVFQNLMEIGHALKCGCWGHETALLH